MLALALGFVAAANSTLLRYMTLLTTPDSANTPPRMAHTEVRNCRKVRRVSLSRTCDGYVPGHGDACATQYARRDVKRPHGNMASRARRHGTWMGEKSYLNVTAGRTASPPWLPSFDGVC